MKSLNSKWNDILTHFALNLRQNSIYGPKVVLLKSLRPKRTSTYEKKIDYRQLGSKNKVKQQILL